MQEEGSPNHQVEVDLFSHVGACLDSISAEVSFAKAFESSDGSLHRDVLFRIGDRMKDISSLLLSRVNIFQEISLPFTHEAILKLCASKYFLGDSSRNFDPSVGSHLDDGAPQTETHNSNPIENIENEDSNIGQTQNHSQSHSENSASFDDGGDEEVPGTPGAMDPFIYPPDKMSALANLCHEEVIISSPENSDIENCNSSSKIETEPLPAIQGPTTKSSQRSLPSSSSQKEVQTFDEAVLSSIRRKHRHPVGEKVKKSQSRIYQEMILEAATNAKSSKEKILRKKISRSSQRH